MDAKTPTVMRVRPAHVAIGAIGVAVFGYALSRAFGDDPKTPVIRADGHYGPPIPRAPHFTPLPNLPYVNVDEALVTPQSIQLRYLLTPTVGPGTPHISPPTALSAELSHRGPMRVMTQENLTLRNAADPHALGHFDMDALPVHVTHDDGDGNVLAYVDAADKNVAIDDPSSLNEFLCTHWHAGAEILAYRPDGTHYAFAVLTDPDKITSLASTTPWAVLW